MQIVEAGSGGKVTIVVGIEGDDAVRLEKLATKRGQKPGEVVAELIRKA